MSDDLADLIEPHIPALRRYAYALCRDASGADDLVQDCLERAISAWQFRRRDASLKAWLFTILHNRFISGLRRVERRSRTVPYDELENDLVSEPGQERALEIRDLRAALARLPGDQQAVLLLVGVEELSYEEAARALDIPIGTVMSRLSRGREKLRRLLDGADRPVELRRVK